jgi:hypothetical protein
MSWQSFVLGLAPYLVTLMGLVLAAFWGRQALAAKDAQLSAKDEQLNTLKLMAPERVTANVRALHAYYKDEAELTKAELDKASEQLAAAGTESQELRNEVGQLREELSMFEFGTASTAASLLEESTVSATSVSRLIEHSVRRRNDSATGPAASTLTQRKLRELEDAGFVPFLDEDPVQWKVKAQHSYDATHAFIKEIRPGDLVPLLVAELEVTPAFRQYLNSKGLKQRYWSEWFAELIIERFWSQLTNAK